MALRRVAPPPPPPAPKDSKTAFSPRCAGEKDPAPTPRLAFAAPGNVEPVVRQAADERQRLRAPDAPVEEEDDLAAGGGKAGLGGERHRVDGLAGAGSDF